MYKKLGALLVLLFILGGTVGAYAWWDSRTRDEEETINIGHGVTLEVEAVAEAPEGKFLIPVGAIVKSDDVTEVVLTYNVAFNYALAEDLYLVVTHKDVEIDGDDSLAHLVNIDIHQAEAMVNNVDVLVTVTVTLSEPADQAEYDAIANKPITFTLTFTGQEEDPEA